MKRMRWRRKEAEKNRQSDNWVLTSNLSKKEVEGGWKLK